MGESKVNYISQHTGVKGCRRGGEEENQLREVMTFKNREEMNEKFKSLSTQPRDEKTRLSIGIGLSR